MAVKRSNRIVAVDWDARTLRLAHAQLSKRGVKIERVLSVAIPADVDPSSPEQMGRHIRRALDQEGISTRAATVDVPRDQATLNMLSLPVTAPDQLPGMVRIQVAKELPFAVADAAIDFTAGTAVEGASTADVLVAAVRNEVIEQYRATLAAAGLRLERIGLRSYANKVAICELLRHSLPEFVLFVDVRPTFTEIGILQRGFLAFSRAASVVIPRELDAESGSISLSALREALEDRETAEAPRPVRPAASPVSTVVRSLVDEVSWSIEAYRSKGGEGRIDHVVISGDLGLEDKLAEALQERLDVNVELYNPASTFGWEPDEGAEAAAFAASFGLLLSHAAEGLDHFDFLHPKKMESQAQKRLRKAPLVAAVVLLFVAAGVIGILEATKADRRALAEINRQIEELQAGESDAKSFVSLVRDVRSFDEDQLVWVDVLHDVMTALPSNEELVLERIDLKQREGRIDIVTRAKRRAVATEVVRRLEDFRREGREKPRFRAKIGPQTEKPGEKYPFTQKFNIEVLDDASPRRKGTTG